MYGRIPLFPPSCGCSGSMRMQLFDNCREPCRSTCEECQTVRICNPACSGEYADVELCVDAGGNLSICVHRPPRPCRQPRCKSRCSSDWVRWNQ